MSAVRAPSEDGAIVADPPLMRVGDLIRTNRVLFPRHDELRRLARRELLTAARAYLQERGEPLPSEADPDCLLVAGHQPELFHPGVWAKNFALCGLARRLRVTAVNLIVDGDTLKSASLRVPVLEGTRTKLRTFAFDHWRGLPWEEHRVGDPERFAGFGELLCSKLRPWGIEPLAGELWSQIRPGSGPLGEAFAAARRGLERVWGCHNLEVPLSVVCRGEAFAWFARGLLAEPGRLLEAYNAVVREHRRKSRTRSKNHPVPDLASEGEWLESPLWGWTSEWPRRSRVFVRSTVRGIELRIGERRADLPSPREGHGFIAAWRKLEESGLKVRSRALTTTLFARLFLADVFMHGIGGGKYDELTDELMRRFFGVTPPGFMVLSATRLLPLPRLPPTRERADALRRRLRDLAFNPQRHLSEMSAQVERLAQERREWVAMVPETAEDRCRRYRALRDLTERLRPAVADQREAAFEALRHADLATKENAVRFRRDYSFCLYPEATLRPFLTGLMGG